MKIRWHIATVETAGHSTWSSPAFSPSGKPAIAYYSSFYHALRFATLRDDGTWDIIPVDTAFSDCKPSLAFSPSGQPAISYYDSSNYTIKYAVGTIFRTPIDDLISFLGWPDASDEVSKEACTKPESSLTSAFGTTAT